MWLPSYLSLYIIIFYYLSVYLSSYLLSLHHKSPSVGNLASGCLVTRSSSSVPRPCHLLTPSIIHSGNMSSRVPQLTYIPSIFIMGIATFLPQVSFTDMRSWVSQHDIYAKQEYDIHMYLRKGNCRVLGRYELYSK